MVTTRALKPYHLGWWLRGAIRAYQITLSPVLGGNCRYSPSCSAYGLEAVETHGGVRGGWLALKRLGRCHPFREGGFDPVPPVTPGAGEA